MISYNKERRLARRIPARIEAYIFTGSNTYVGFIENISSEGFEFLIPTSSKAPKGLQHEQTVDIYFQIHSGEVIDMSCQVKWILRKSPYDESLTIGMKISDLTPKLKALIKTLEIVNIN